MTRAVTNYKGLIFKILTFLTLSFITLPFVFAQNLEQKEAPMTFAVRHISVSIGRPAGEVYAFASNPENWPKWATGLGASIKKVSGEWVAEGPMGKVKVRFAEKNKFGILDHEVILESGKKVHNPMRVVPNNRGSEVIFTLFRQPEVADEKFSEDAQWVTRDLNKLKSLLEK